MAVLSEIFHQELATVVVFLLFSLISWYYWSHRKILLVAWKLPCLGSLPAFPIVGHGYLAVHGTQWCINYGIKVMKNNLISNPCGKQVFWVGPYPFFFVTDPEDVHTLFSSSKALQGGLERPLFGFALKNGLITAPVNVWKVTRRHVSSMFVSRNLKMTFPVVNECGRDLVASLTQHVDSGLVNIEPLVDPIAVKSVCKLIFGPKCEVNMESAKFLNLMEAITRISQLPAERMLKMYAWPRPIFRLLYRREIEKIEDGCNGFIDEAIEASRMQRLKHDSSSNQSSNAPSNNCTYSTDSTAADDRVQKTLEDTVKTLQENYATFTNKYLNYEARNLLLGGSESTRVTVSYFLLAIAAHPHIQEKLYSEIVSVTGPQDSDVTPEDIRAMPYLDQVLKETLRKFLIIPLITRRAQGDIQLKDWTLPKGSLVGVVTFGVHYNPKLYPEPERFDPDRFSPENVAARGKNCFITFSGGLRNCIGKNYSMLVIKTLLIHVVRRFKFSTTVDIDTQTVTAGAITSFTDGYKVVIEARQKTQPIPQKNIV